MARKNNRRWISDHISDFFVLQSQKLGYRSRSAFKLIEIDDRFRFLSKARIILDLGSAPGGWSQVAAERASQNTRLYALDQVEMDPISRVSFFQGDFSTSEGEECIHNFLLGDKINVLLSDMLPNMSGHRSTDQARSVGLCEMVLDLAIGCLKKDGVMVLKILQGEGTQEFHAQLKQVFQRVIWVKPKSSRPSSREIYFYTEGLKTL